MEKTNVKKHKKLYFILGGIIAVGLILWRMRGILLSGLLFLGSMNAKVEVNTDIDDYQRYIGVNADEEYINKWDMDESIFPQEITENMSVKDYKMVYYNPWDAQYLSYLVVQYDAESYGQELERLKSYSSTEYIGYYGAQGFDDQYDLLAMNADSYQGFVYALTDRKDTILYVEIIFCNYSMNLEYTEYIKEEFLPLGFDATYDNPYRQKMTE